MADNELVHAQLLERLRAGLHSGDVSQLAPLLAENVRWGGDDGDTPQTCHTRGEVLAWFGGWQTAGARVEVVDTMSGSDVVVLGLAVDWPVLLADDGLDRPARSYCVMRIRDGLIYDIRDCPQRDEAMAIAGLPA
jgi:hypothetical protein